MTSFADSLVLSGDTESGGVKGWGRELNMSIMLWGECYKFLRNAETQRNIYGKEVVDDKLGDSIIRKLWSAPQIPEKFMHIFI